MLLMARRLLDAHAPHLVEEAHKRLDELLPMIEAQANEAETLGYLTDDVVAAMRKAGHAVSAGGGKDFPAARI